MTRLYRFWRNPYFFASVFAFALISINNLLPIFVQNEQSYLIPSRRIIDPSFLQRDWSMGEGATTQHLAVLFSTLMAPLWYFLRDAVLVGMTGRVIVWGFLLFAMAKVARQAGAKWYSFAVGVGLWVYTWQSLGAAEWIFGGVEQKCFAYVFLFLSLACLLRFQSVRAGIFCGIAASFHVLVGVWGAVALAGAMLLRYREYGLRRLLQFAGLVLVVSVPILLVAVRYVAGGVASGAPVAGGAEVDSLVVLFRNPFHLDPDFFLTSRELLRAPVYVICAFLCVGVAAEGSRRRFLLSFLSVLVALYLSGIFARRLDFFWFLRYYPFRVPDVLLPFFFYILAPGVLVEQVRFLLRKPRPQGWRAYVAAGLVLVFTGVLLNRTYRAASRFPERWSELATSWTDYLEGRRSPFQQAADWIRRNTEESATVAAHPCEPDLWLESERAMVMNIKSGEHNSAVLEWRRRAVALNGDCEFQTTGFAICDEFSRNLPGLSLSQLAGLRMNYGADYYLIARRRSDLEDRLLYENGSYYLYGLEDLTQPRGSGP